MERLGIGDADGENPSRSPPGSEQAASAAPKKPFDNVKKPVYLQSTLEDGTTSADNEDKAQSSRAKRPKILKLPFGGPSTSLNRDRASGLKLDYPDPRLSFLPTEAQRVATPPSAGQPNPFSHSPRSPLSPTRSPQVERSSGSVDLSANVFRAPVEEENQADKYINVPEHLPTSPLCPRHPKHKSRGTGICPYHGKN